MYVCLTDSAAEVLVHKNLKTSPQALMRVIEPYREDLAVAVECVFVWYWIADLCTRLGVTFVLGHALYMKAIHGGKVKNDRIDSEKIVHLLRSGMLPEAYAYPSEMRSTRDLLRRRMYLVRKHAELLGHIQNTRHQYNMAAFEKRIDRVSNRIGITDRFDDPMVAATVEVDSHLLDALHEQILFIERRIGEQARDHDPVAVQLLRTIPGVGNTLALTILYEIGDIARFPQVGNFISYSRLVKCSHESAGKRSTGKNSKIGNAHLKWAFSEAACLFCEEQRTGSSLAPETGQQVRQGEVTIDYRSEIGPHSLHNIEEKNTVRPDQVLRITELILRRQRGENPKHNWTPWPDAHPTGIFLRHIW